MIAQHYDGSSNRIAHRWMRVGVSANGTIIGEAGLAPGSDVRIGRGDNATVVVEEWPAEALTLISDGIYLHLQPGMSLHMCHDNGEDRVRGSYEELVSKGMCPPILINVSKLNISIGAGVSVFVKYLTNSEMGNGPIEPDKP